MTHTGLATDWVSWRVGPFHPMLPGPVVLHLQLDGEHIASAKFESGYAHRGLEKAMELLPWAKLLPFSSHVDPEAAPAYEALFCEAVEEIIGLSVPARASAARRVLEDLATVSEHLLFFAKVARSVEAQMFERYAIRDREKALDLFELLTGARFAGCYSRFGGLSEDITDGFLERAVEFARYIELRLDEYRNVFLGVELFAWRARGLAPVRLDKERMKHLFEGNVGDVWSRVQFREKKIRAALARVRSVADTMPTGKFREDWSPTRSRVPSGEAIRWSDGPRGRIGVHVVSDGGISPVRVHWVTPSRLEAQGAESALVGERVEDLALILASFDLSVAEIDR